MLTVLLIWEHKSTFSVKKNIKQAQHKGVIFTTICKEAVHIWPKQGEKCASNNRMHQFSSQIFNNRKRN